MVGVGNCMATYSADKGLYMIDFIKSMYGTADLIL